jgi:hypothetical protein
MYRTVPNSHGWGSLEGILTCFKIEPEIMTKEYISIGLENTLKIYESDIKLTKKVNNQNSGPVFTSINDMIIFLNHDEYNQKIFIDIINNTIYNGLNIICKRKMERREVYKRIDGERDYQNIRYINNLREDDVPDEEKPVAEWINYIEYHLEKAKNQNYHLNKEAALAEIRKVTALAVRCMEIHGCPERIIK